MPVVGLAEVLVVPSFNNSQRSISNEFGPAAQRAGRTAGRSLGRGISEGVASETDGLEAEVARLSQAVAKASDKVTASRARMTAASTTEERALGALRVAELKLAEARENANAKASQIAAAEERVSAARARAATATTARETAERNLSTATRDHTRATEDSSRASADLESNMRRVTAEAANSERSIGRLSSLLSRAFRGRPLADFAQSIRDDSQRVEMNVLKMTRGMAQQSANGGRAVSQAFIGITGALSAIIPAAGAAGSAVIAASGAVLTLASSMKQLAGVAALAPAALVTVGAAGGVLKAAFSGVGEALKTATEQSKAFSRAASGENPRLAAMALEDAVRGVADAERSAADARVSAARRVEDAQMSLRDAEEAAADSAEASAEAQVQAARRVGEAQRSLKETIDDVAAARADAVKAVELAQRREVEAARGVIDAQKDLTEARDEAQAAVKNAGRASFDADRDAVDTALAYKKAIEAYNAAVADPDSSADTIAQLNNNVAKAYAADRDAQDAVLSTKQAHEQAKREAVEGSEAVFRAEQRLADARQAEADAVQARKDAQAAVIKQQEEGAQRIADAELAVTDAVKDQDRTRDEAAKSAEQSSRVILDAQRGIADAEKAGEQGRLDGIRAVEQAQRNLERVQLQQADAAASAAEQAGQAGEESAAAMANLTPAAQTAVAALLGVYEQLGNIRRIAQENFFTGFAAPLLTLAGTVMPQLVTGVGAIASALGTAAQQVMTSLTSALGSGVLEGLLTSVATVITNLTPAIDPLVQAFVTLASVGMPYMEDLATSISNASIRFNEFIQQAAGDGSLNTWIDAGLQGFRDLGSILGSVSGIFGALADAARAGGIDTTLGSIAANLNAVETAMQGSAFQGTMATIFEGAAAGARGLRDALGPIGEAFRTGAPALAEFLRLGGEIAGTFIGGVFTALSDPSFGAGLKTFLEAVQRGVGVLVPLLPGLSSAFGGILTAIAPIAEQLGPSLITIFTGLANGLAAVIGFLSPFLTYLASSPALIVGVVVGVGLLVGAANLLATSISLIGVQATLTGVKMAAAWVVGLGPIGLAIAAVAALVAGVAWFFTQTELGQQIVQSAWAGIQTAVSAVVSWFQTYVQPVLDQVLSFLGSAFSWLYENVIKPVFAGIQWYIGMWWDVVSGIFNAVVGFVRGTLIPAFEYLSYVIGYVFDVIGQLIGAAWRLVIKPLFDAVVAFVRDVLVPRFELFQRALGVVFDVVGQIISNAWQRVIQPILDAVVGFVRDKLGPIFEWLRNVIGPVWDVISSKISDVWNNNVRPVFDAIKTAVGLIPAAFEAAKNGIGDAWDAIKAKVKEPIRAVVGFINEGLIDKFNDIPGVEIQPLKLPPGFYHGGYTGDIDPRKAAGVVHGREFVFTAAQTAALGKENLANMAHAAVRGGVRGAAATTGEGNMGGFFEGNAANIARHGAYYMSVASGMDGWNFPGAAKLWDGAAGVKVATGFGKHQGRVYPRERGGGILGYTTGNDIDMSPSWMNQLAPKQRLTVAAHEIGHALGLPHNSLSSIMQPNLGNMAATPTAVDIRNLQRLYPGGSGKAGEASDAVSNPFDGLIDGLASKLKEAFPNGGMFIDAAAGLAKAGIEQVTKIVTDIKDGISKIAGDVFGKVKDFFGGGAAVTDAPLWRDGGGIIPPGISRVLNQTGGNELALNPTQVRNLLSFNPRGQVDATPQVVLQIEKSYGDPQHLVSAWQEDIRRGVTLNDIRKAARVG